jgi:predicted DNA-binding protein
MKPVSKRNFIKGEKVTVSIRLPEELKRELEKLAEQTGRGFSDFVQEGLDQWAALHRKQAKP